MILSQQFVLKLECSTCKELDEVYASNKNAAFRSARDSGWVFSRSTHACWCSQECRPETVPFVLGRGA